LFVTILLVALEIILYYSFINKAFTKNSEKMVFDEAVILKKNVEDKLNIGINQTITLANILTTLRNNESTKREDVVEILRKLLLGNEQLFGVWTVWEENAFDGKDSLYRDAPYHNDNGRFAPFWFRSSNKIDYSILYQYDTPGIGNYYLIPKTTKKIHILPPYSYNLNNEEVVVTSIVVPIIINGDFYGVVGIDLRIEMLQQFSIPKSLKKEEGTTLYTADGKVAAHFMPSRVGEKYMETDTDIYPELLEKIKGAFENKDTTFDQIYSDLFGEEIYVVSLPVITEIEEQNWRFNYLKTVDSAAVVNVPNINVIIIFIFSGLCIFSVISYYIARFYLKPVFEGVIFAENIAFDSISIDQKISTQNRNCEGGRMVRALLKIHFLLQKRVDTIKEENRERTWLQTGQNELFKIMRGNPNIKQLAADMIQYVTKYINAQVGAVYIADRSKEILLLAGKYSLIVNKPIPEILLYGETTTGQAFVDNRLLMIENLPPDFATFNFTPVSLYPKYLIIIPFENEGAPVGVIELGMFKKPENRDILFLQSIVENVAIALTSAQYRERMEWLLEARKTQKKEMLRNIKELKNLQKGSTIVQTELKSIIDAIDNTLMRAEFDLKGHIIRSNKNFNDYMKDFGKNKVNFSVKDMIADGDVDNFNDKWENISDYRFFIQRFKLSNNKTKEYFYASLTPIKKINGRIYKVLFLATETLLI